MQRNLKMEQSTRENTLGSLNLIMLSVPVQFDESKSSNHLSKYLLKA